MVLRKKISSLIIFGLINTQSFADSKLPILSTKQAIENLRFISNDGKYTYYQRRSGSFLFSSNYKVEESIKLKEMTHYQVIASKSKKWLLVSANENYHTYFSPRANQKIYKIPYGKSKATQIGSGINPALHYGDKWASWFDSYKKELTFIDLKNKDLSFTIKTSNIKNPYFIPKALFINSNEIFIIDINRSGLPGILSYKINSRKIKLFQKFDTSNTRIEVCMKDKSIFVGRFGLNGQEKASQIRVMKIKELDYTNSKLLYSSQVNDIGQLNCDIHGDNIYFIKNNSVENKKYSSEVARLNIKTKKIDIISDIGYVTQLINMDGKLLLPHNGAFRVLLGENNMTQFDLLKAKGKKDKIKEEEVGLK